MAPTNLYRYYARLSAAVMVKIVLVLSGFLLGKKLDVWFGTAPLLMFLGFVTGVGVGLWYVIRTANKES
jgi:F0F1-type ATP synthase assembly protein I